MDPCVIGDFRVECGGEDVALLQCDHIAVGLAHHPSIRTGFGDEGTADEHKREVLDHASRSAVGVECGDALGGRERPQLAAVGVAAQVASSAPK